MKEGTYGVVVRMVHATLGVVATKMSEGPPLESLTLLKIRPSLEETSLTQSSHNLCRVSLLKIQHEKYTR